MSRRRSGTILRKVAELERAIADLSKPNTVRFVLAAFGDWAVIVATLVCAAELDHPFGYALALFPLGSRQQGLGALFHDAAHGLVSRRRWLNDGLGSVLAAWPLGLTLGGYRRYHFAHHKLLGTEGDPEISHKRAMKQWELPASPFKVTRDFLSDLVLGGLPHLVVAGRLTRPVRLAETLGFLLFWSLIALVAWSFDAIWVPVLFVAAIATVFWSGVRLRIWTEHLGTRDTHRIGLPSWVAWLVMPHNIGMHWEHHHYPGVPFFNLPRLRRLLTEEAGYPPVLPLAALLRAFARSAALQSGGIAETVDREGNTEPDKERLERSAREVSLLRLGAHVGLPLISGVAVYLTCRATLPSSLAWFPYGGRLLERMPATLSYVLPDFLWAYALTAALLLIWSGGSGRARYGWVVVAALIAVALELAQAAGILPGTYAGEDVLSSLAGCGLAVVLCPHRRPAWTALTPLLKGS